MAWLKLFSRGGHKHEGMSHKNSKTKTNVAMHFRRIRAQCNPNCRSISLPAPCQLQSQRRLSAFPIGASHASRPHPHRRKPLRHHASPRCVRHRATRPHLPSRTKPMPSPTWLTARVHLLSLDRSDSAQARAACSSRKRGGATETPARLTPSARRRTAPWPATGRGIAGYRSPDRSPPERLPRTVFFPRCLRFGSFGLTAGRDSRHQPSVANPSVPSRRRQRKTAAIRMATVEDATCATARHWRQQGIRHHSR